MENRFEVRLKFAFPFSNPSLWKGFCSTETLNLFQIIMDSLFLARHD